MATSSSESERADNDADFKHAENDRVFCEHMGNWYEAKIQKRSSEKEIKYWVHYHGWNKNWDEWATEDRIIPYNEENRKMATEIKKKKGKHDDSNGGGGGGGGGSGGGSGGGGKDGSLSKFASKAGGKRKSLIGETQQDGKEDSVSPTVMLNNGAAGNATAGSGGIGNTGGKAKEDSSKDNASNTTATTAATAATNTTGTPKGIPSKRAGKRSKIYRDPSEIIFIEHHKDIQIDVPGRLKEVLIDDRRYVQQQMLLKLPATNSVCRVLDDYVRDRFAKVNAGDINRTLASQYASYGSQFYKSCFREVVSGLKVYFNMVLGTQLLYRFERVQYAECRQQLLAKMMILDTTNATNVNNNNNNNNHHHRLRKNSVTSKQSSNSNNNQNNSNSITDFASNESMDSSGTTTTTATLDDTNDNNNNNNNDPELDFTAHYSVVHLLRLFTKLHKMFAYLPADKKVMELLLNFVGDVIEYIDQNHEQLFHQSDYFAPSSEYMRKARD